MKKLALFASALISASSAHALITPFDLIGTAGSGLRAGNEPGSIIGGTGGEILNTSTGLFGIFFDDLGTVGNGGTLTINVGWGSGNGFTDLSSNVSNQHIHGPVAANFGFNGTANFTQTSGNTIALTRTSTSPVNGQILNTVTMTGTQEADLFSGKFYVNVHTLNNGGGEVRGFLIPVPEPSTAALAAAGLVGFLGRRRRAA